MVPAILNLLADVALVLGAVWLLLALIGLKINSFKTLRWAYTRCLFRLVSGAATWLWFTPPVQREGGGHIADPYLQYPAEFPGEPNSEEVEPWP